MLIAEKTSPHLVCLSGPNLKRTWGFSITHGATLGGFSERRLPWLPGSSKFHVQAYSYVPLEHYPDSASLEMLVPDSGRAGPLGSSPTYPPWHQAMAISNLLQKREEPSKGIRHHACFEAGSAGHRARFAVTAASITRAIRRMTLMEASPRKVYARLSS